MVNMALVLTEGKPTEMMTSFRPHRLMNSLNSSWWEFTVASYNGHVWTKRCTGEVSALSSNLGPGQDPDALPRKINATKWYENMCKGGLDLGPCFQTLDTIETSTNSDNWAIGKVINGRQGDEANYHIHPTVLDGTIQLLGAAAVNGYARKTKNWLPTSIDKFSVYRCSSDMISSVSARLSSNHSVVGDGHCTSGGMTVIEAFGIRMSLADGALSSDVPNTYAAARYEWGSNIDFMDVKELIRAPTDRTDNLRLLEELGQLCLLSSKRLLSGSQTNLPHLQKYMAWLVSQARSAVTNLASVLKSLDNETVSARIEDLVARLSETPAAPAASAIHQVCKKMDLLLSGQTLEDILPDKTLTNLYEFVDQSTDASSFRIWDTPILACESSRLEPAGFRQRMTSSRTSRVPTAEFSAPSTPSPRRASSLGKIKNSYSPTWNTSSWISVRIPSNRDSRTASTILLSQRTFSTRQRTSRKAWPT